MKKLQQLYADYIRQQWAVIASIGELRKKYSVTEIANLKLWDSFFIRWCGDIYKVGIYDDLSPSYIYELVHVGSKKRLRYIKLLRENNYTIKEFRRLIREENSVFKNDGVKIPNSRFHKNLFFFKRGLNGKDNETKEKIIEELNK